MIPGTYVHPSVEYLKMKIVEKTNFSFLLRVSLQKKTAGDMLSWLFHYSKWQILRTMYDMLK